MKFLIVILAIITLAYAEGDYKVKSAAEILAIEEECLKELSLSEEQAKKVQDLQFSDEEEVRKYLLCSVKKMDVFCEKTGYSPENIAKQFKVDLDEAEVLALVQGCADKNEQGSSADVWAYRGNKCLEATKLGEHIKAYIKKAKEEAKKE